MFPYSYNKPALPRLIFEQNNLLTKSISTVPSTNGSGSHIIRIKQPPLEDVIPKVLLPAEIYSETLYKVRATEAGMCRYNHVKLTLDGLAIFRILDLRLRQIIRKKFA